MSRTRSPAIIKRNDQMFAEWRRGASLTSIAAQYGVSRQVVGKVVASFHPEEEEDGERALYRGYLWRLFDEVKDLYDSPGYKLSPSGGPAKGPDGEPAVDTNTQLQAAELELKILESLRKLDARDRPQKSLVTHELARQQADEALAAVRERVTADQRELEGYRRQVTAVPGEIVRELPPA